MSYWVGNDHCILDDVTRFGLHRKHITRRGELPDQDRWLSSLQKGIEPELQLYMGQDGNGHLWIYWKENEIQKAGVRTNDETHDATP